MQRFVSSYHEYTQGDYKWSQRLHHLIDKKVTGTQKLNARRCKEQLENVCSARMPKK